MPDPEADPWSLTDCGSPDCTRLHPCAECTAFIRHIQTRRTQNAWWL